MGYPLNEQGLRADIRTLRCRGMPTLPEGAWGCFVNGASSIAQPCVAIGSPSGVMPMKFRGMAADGGCFSRFH